MNLHLDQRLDTIEAPVRALFGSLSRPVQELASGALTVRRLLEMALPEHVESADVGLDDSAVHPSALRLTLASPLYRGAAVALFLSGLGFSAAARRSPRSWSRISVRR